MFVIDKNDLNGTGNGDVCIRTDKGTLVALIFAGSQTMARASVVAAALNAAFSPSMTDLMVDPESLDAFMEANPLPDEFAHHETLLDDGRRIHILRGAAEDAGVDRAA